MTEQHDLQNLTQLAVRYDFPPDELRRRLAASGLAVAADKDLLDVDAVAAALARRDTQIAAEVVARWVGGVPKDWGEQVLNDAIGKLREKYFGDRNSDLLKQRFDSMSHGLRLHLAAQMPCALRALLQKRMAGCHNVEEQAVCDLEIAGGFDQWHKALTEMILVSKPPVEAGPEPTVNTSPEPVVEVGNAIVGPSPRRGRRAGG